MTKLIFQIILICIILTFQLEVFACDTLCVVYNGGNKKFEIDSSKAEYWCKCNQKELGIYANFFDKLTIPIIMIESGLTGSTYLIIKGKEIKILRGVYDGLNEEITNCYNKNNFYFDSVFFRIRVPFISIRGTYDNTPIKKEELYKDKTIPKTSKKIDIIASDMNHFVQTQEFNKKHKLIDLFNTKDSLFIRINTGTLLIENNIYEIKYNNNRWQARIISYRHDEFRKFGFGFVLFNKHWRFYCNNFANAFFLNQRKVIPIDSINNTISWDSISYKLNKYDLLHLKSKNVADTSNIFVDDGIWAYIEIATPEIYRFIYWDNPKYASVSKDSKAIQELFNLLFKEFDVEKYEKHKYKKNKWRK